MMQIIGPDRDVVARAGHVLDCAEDFVPKLCAFARARAGPSRCSVVGLFWSARFFCLSYFSGHRSILATSLGDVALWPASPLFASIASRLVVAGTETCSETASCRASTRSLGLGCSSCLSRPLSFSVARALFFRRRRGLAVCRFEVGRRCWYRCYPIPRAPLLGRF